MAPNMYRGKNLNQKKCPFNEKRPDGSKYPKNHPWESLGSVAKKKRVDAHEEWELKEKREEEARTRKQQQNKRKRAQRKRDKEAREAREAMNDVSGNRGTTGGTGRLQMVQRQQPVQQHRPLRVTENILGSTIFNLCNPIIQQRARQVDSCAKDTNNVSKTIRSDLEDSEAWKKSSESASKQNPMRTEGKAGSTSIGTENKKNVEDNNDCRTVSRYEKALKDNEDCKGELARVKSLYEKFLRDNEELKKKLSALTEVEVQDVDTGAFTTQPAAGSCTDEPAEKRQRASEASGAAIARHLQRRVTVKTKDLEDEKDERQLQITATDALMTKVDELAALALAAGADAKAVNDIKSRPLSH